MTGPSRLQLLSGKYSRLTAKAAANVSKKVKTRPMIPPVTIFHTEHPDAGSAALLRFRDIKKPPAQFLVKNYAGECSVITCFLPGQSQRVPQREPGLRDLHGSGWPIF